MRSHSGKTARSARSRCSRTRTVDKSTNCLRATRAPLLGRTIPTRWAVLTTTPTTAPMARIPGLREFRINENEARYQPLVERLNAWKGRESHVDVRQIG